MVIASNSRPVTGMPPTEQESWKVGLLQRRSSHCLLNRKSQGFQRNTDNVVLSTPTSGPLVSSYSLCAELPSVPQKHKQSQGALSSNPTARKEMGGLCTFYEVWVSGFFSTKIWSSIKCLVSVERTQRLSSTPQVQSRSPEFYPTLTRALVSEGQMQVHIMYWKAHLCMSNRRGRSHVHTCPISGKGHTYNRWANRNLMDVLTLSNLNITLCVDLPEQGWEASVWEHPHIPE